MALPDYILADLNHPELMEGTALRAQAARLTFPLSEEDRKDIQTVVSKFESEGLTRVGLAAPQLGIAKRFVVVRVSENIADLQDCPEFPQSVLINPSYERVGEDKSFDMETCYSLPNLFVPLKRYTCVTYAAQTESGEDVRGEAHGFLARVLQHEVDHLDGKMFSDGVPTGYIVTREQHEEIMRKVHPTWTG